MDWQGRGSSKHTFQANPVEHTLKQQTPSVAAHLPACLWNQGRECLAQRLAHCLQPRLLLGALLAGVSQGLGRAVELARIEVPQVTRVQAPLMGEIAGQEGQARNCDPSPGTSEAGGRQTERKTQSTARRRQGALSPAGAQLRWRCYTLLIAMLAPTRREA